MLAPARFLKQSRQDIVFVVLVDQETRRLADALHVIGDPADADHVGPVADPEDLARSMPIAGGSKDKKMTTAMT